MCIRKAAYDFQLCRDVAPSHRNSDILCHCLIAHFLSYLHLEWKKIQRLVFCNHTLLDARTADQMRVATAHAR